MFCPECGTRNSTSNAYCRHCGKPLGEGPAIPIPSMMPANEADDDTGRLVAVGPDAGGVTAVPASVMEATDDLLRRAYDARNRGATAEAIALAQAAVSRAPDDVRGYSLLGNVYESADMIPEAIEAYETAVALAPEDKVDRYRLSLLRERTPNGGEGPATARPVHTRAFDPPAPAPSAPVRMGQDTGARAWTRVMPVAAAVTVFVVSLVGGACLVLRSGRGPATDSVSSSSPADVAAAYVSRGRFHFERGDYAGARNQFLLALADTPGNSEAAYWLNEVQGRLGILQSPPGSEASVATAEGLPLPAEAPTGQPGPGDGARPGSPSGIPPAVDAQQNPASGAPQATGVPTGPAPVQPYVGPSTAIMGDRGGVLSQTPSQTGPQVPELFRSLADTGGASRRPGPPPGPSSGPLAAEVIRPGSGGSGVSMTEEGPVGSGGSLPSDLNDILRTPTSTAAGSDTSGAQSTIVIRGSGSVRPAGARGPSSQPGDADLNRGLSLRARGDRAGARAALQHALESYQRQSGVAGDAGAKTCKDLLNELDRGQ